MVFLVTAHTSIHLQQGVSKNFLADTKAHKIIGNILHGLVVVLTGMICDDLNMVEKDNDGAGAISSMRRPKTNVIDHKSIRHNDDGTLTYEHITMDNATHSTDAFTREAVRMVWQHNSDKDGPLFLYLPFTAPHWPTQFFISTMLTLIPTYREKEAGNLLG